MSPHEIQQHDGIAPESFVSDSIERYKDRLFQEEETKYVAIQVFAGAWCDFWSVAMRDNAEPWITAAAETTIAATMSFILAMLMHPDIQAKAQTEVDSIIGSDRLPDFSEQPHLPYLAAILKEVLR